MIIKIRELLDTCVLMAPEKAKKLREVILEAVADKKEIVLDFSEIRTVTLSFLYYTFKGIRKELTKREKSLLQIKNPTSSLYEELEYLKLNYKELSLKFKKVERMNAIVYPIG
ncbi:MAG: STAS-like domain-containing protein [Fusobacteriaceae bacterium]